MFNFAIQGIPAIGNKPMQLTAERNIWNLQVSGVY